MKDKFVKFSDNLIGLIPNCLIRMLLSVSNTYQSKCISQKSFFSSHSDLLTCADQNSRIDCNWDIEFLCGDKCVRNGRYCACGKKYFDWKLANSFYCCKEPNTSCKKTRNGHIQCQGQVLRGNKPCHGSCRQYASYGLTLLPCADQKECYLGTHACRGKPQCTE